MTSTASEQATRRPPVDRLEARLAEARGDGRAALVAYGVAGYPDRDTALAAFRAMAEAGADVLEVGPPYSDPLIDGPVIQRAVQAALDHGTRLDDVFAMVSELTADPSMPPVVLLLYYNLIAHRGPDRFASELAASGACGAVVADLPPEEAGEWLAASERAAVARGSGAAPARAAGRGGSGGSRVRVCPGDPGRDRPASVPRRWGRRTGRADQDAYRPAGLRRHRGLERRAGGVGRAVRGRGDRRHRPGTASRRRRSRGGARSHRRARHSHPHRPRHTLIPAALSEVRTGCTGRPSAGPRPRAG
jgi:hypothetical protein